MRILMFWLLMVLLPGCADEQDTDTVFHKLKGETMGTTYHVTFEGGTDAPVSKFQLDSLLAMINQSSSTYIPTSLISRLNQGDVIQLRLEEQDEVEFFRYNTSIADDVWKWSEGYFDPTVMPLVNYWGFGYEGHRPVETVDSARIDSLLQYVGYGAITGQWGRDEWHLAPGFKLDFSAVAKGAACDRMGVFLQEKGVDNYLIEIGGEMMLRGPGRKGDGWIIGISRPEKNAPERELIEEMAIQNRGVATSGNYRNYYETDGRLISHTINPKTGYSEQRNILSATVIADQCGKADALATAMMAMGVDKSISMIEQLSNVDVFLVYNNAVDSVLIYETPGIKELKYNIEP